MSSVKINNLTNLLDFSSLTSVVMKDGVVKELQNPFHFLHKMSVVFALTN